MPTVEETSNADGVIDFGPARYGMYSMTLTSPWGESSSSNLTVRPGRGIDETIVCPVPPENLELAVEIDWPEDLKSAKLCAFCNFYYAPDPPKDSRLPWFFQFNFDVPTHLLLLNSGEMINCGFSATYDKQSLENAIGNGKPVSTIRSLGRQLKLLQVHILHEPGTQPNEPRSTPDGKLNLPENTIASYSYRLPAPVLRSGGGGFGGGGFGGGGLGGGGGFFGPSTRKPGLEINNASPAPGGAGINPATQPEALEAPTFEPKPGQANRWKITLPDELIAYLRQTSLAGISAPDQPK
jgi:hypothetical protein